MRPIILKNLVACCCWVLLSCVVILSPCNAGEEQSSYGIGETVSLAALLDGGFIIAGDKKFSEFEYNLAIGDLQPEDIVVKGIFDSVLDGYGLLFSGSFLAGGLSAPPLLEAGLLFTVTAMDPNYVISDVHLDGTTFVRGTGEARIVENFTGVDVPSLAIFELRMEDELIASRSSDDVFFPDAIDELGFRSLRVIKDIRIEAGENTPNDVAEITSFQQVFTQLRVEVPEPASWGLMVLLGVSVAGFRSRRRFRQ